MKGQRYQVVWGDPERLPSGLVLDAAVVGWLKMGSTDGYRWLQMATDGCRCDDHDFEFLV